MTHLKGKALLEQPFLNKGTAFTEEERTRHGMHGLLPTAVRTLAEQVQLEYEKMGDLADNYQKNQHLMALYNTNRTLYYAIVAAHVTELLPVIYTPTIADSVTRFSRDYVWPNDAVYLDSDHPERIRQALVAGAENLEQVDLLVITDGEGVLGIGDWGIGGVMISVGKLSVYTIAAGMNPGRVLPIVIDNGTNRAELLDDRYYLGKKAPRKTGQSYLAFIDQFIQIAKELFPKVLFHWEDFGRGNASVILEKYREQITTFNDDIQGTGVMMAAAAHAIAVVTEKPVTAHKYVIFGAGTAGVGVTEQIKQKLVLAGLSEAEAVSRFYLVDRDGLITDEMAELTDGQRKYARSEVEFRGLKDLAAIVEAVRPSVLIGTSGQPGAFTEEVVRKMATYNARPAILPISNPTKLCEAKAEDLIKWTDGTALVVTGSPSAPVDYKGVTYQIGQANNALLYPGLGLGIVVAKASTVTEQMLSSAANGIAGLQDLSRLGAPILPPVSLVREASRMVAEAVVQTAIDEGVATREITDVAQAVRDEVWEVGY
ncbi:NAD-dependent malic enzyme [Listeria costaricensis]|uniref:NAD-dependent malic enzyme n=1 Tax=Listeria costaricensis TaxID=2026604 RepID=UPI000C07DA7C|nr:NAD-dependent malic enzyme [Listeria costaricensis]